MKRRAVFLDRDGTINRDVGYPHDYALIEVYPYSFEAVRKIKQAGFLAVIITNQSGVGRGLIEESNLGDIHRRMQASFQAKGAHFDGIYYCPHYIQSTDPSYRKDCSCRKPHPDLGVKAAKDLNIDLPGSYMVGDKVEDIEFGFNIHARPILVLTGYGKASLDKLKAMNSPPAHVAPTLLDAVNWILEQEQEENKAR